MSHQFEEETALLAPYSSHFKQRVFNETQMQARLSEEIFSQWALCVEKKTPLLKSLFDPIAEALKEWAIELGATHYTHWFQPLTGLSAEKHDAFLQWTFDGNLIEQFRGKELFCAEPDASSLPSGGLRATHAARGYAVWDVATAPFLYEAAGILTLCIPALYFSWTGESLDYKIPLIRSEEKLNRQLMRLLKLAGVSAKATFSTLGIEQEFFAIDRSFLQKRPDLHLAQRTLFGTPPAKGQELEDHYFSVLSSRVMDYLREVEEKAIRLGIPLKTRHNEVAPSQHEVAPLFEKASLAVDHNILLMQLMKQIAQEKDLVCLFHEKPFATLNGNGKHCNWSIATDEGKNLLDPEENSMLFLTLLTAILKAVHDHAGLLRASIASSGNDHRLGGAEAPPTILSVFLGSELERLIEDLIEGKTPLKQAQKIIDLQLSYLPHHEADQSDRNRTSFFAFTGNKFEFRAVGGSAHPALPLCVIQAIVSDALQLILDETMDAIGDQELSEEERFSFVLPVLVRHLKESQKVVFGGDAYAQEWEIEAQQRGLPNLTSQEAFKEWRTPKTKRVFKGILSEEEIRSRYEIFVEQYVKTLSIEVELMLELFETRILPAVLEDLQNKGASLNQLAQAGITASQRQFQRLTHFSEAVEEAIASMDLLKEAISELEGLKEEAKATVFAELILPKMEAAREKVDSLEKWTRACLWPLPSYSEMLYLA